MMNANRRLCPASLDAPGPHWLRTALSLAGMLLAIWSISFNCFAQEKSAGNACPPAARNDGTKEMIHGVSIGDPYRWLEDQNSAETRAWIEAEDRCTSAALDSFPGKAAITKRLSELMKVDSVSMPAERNGWYFFAKRKADQDLFVTYKRHGLNGADEVLIDPHSLSADHSTSTGLMGLSRDGSLAAYFVRAGGQDEVTVKFLDTKSGKNLTDELPHGNYDGVSIEPDNRILYYARETEQGPRVFRHVMGAPVAQDKEIFGKGYGLDKIILPSLSDDGRYLLIDVLYGSGITRSELYFEDLQSGDGVKQLVNDVDSLFQGEIQDGKVFVSTNWKAPRWHVYSVDLGNPGKVTAKDTWKEIVPESDAAIENVRALGGKVLVQYIRNATSQVKIFESDGHPAGEISFPTLGAVGGLGGNWNSSDVFIDFSSFNIPDTIYKYSLTAAKLETWAASSVPIDSSAYTVEQVWYESKDKTRVPMFLLYKKGLARDGARPVLLTGYGGFDVNLTPSFTEEAVVWADAGGVFAQPNLRGGGEFGEAWHRAGMMEKKQTVFDDFISAGEWLIANGYTSSKKLAIQGGSNGGLLVGAMLTQRPDLFQAVVCQYPLLDMLRYQKFLRGPFWVPEYGSADDPAQFKYLLNYSPYHNVKDGVKYPAVLFITGDGDTRVAPLHARKMTARLQAATGSSRPILLLYDTKSGHSGGRPLNKEIEETAQALSFLFLQLGVNAN
jgi:prolyl oligopeptidase